MIELNKGYNEDCLELIKRIPDNSLDIICIDPPYLYLKGQKLERDFDEQVFFYECKRVLKLCGFIVMFGRGESFYRWNTILSELKFVFKEEVVWDKSYCSSPLLAMSRIHETISILTKGSGTINRVKVPYLEMKGHDIDALIVDIKRLKVAFKNHRAFDAIIEVIETGVTTCTTNKVHKHNVSAQVSGLKSVDRQAAVMMALVNGMNEKDIIKQQRDHYATIHPTQKPVRLLERLLALVIPKESETITAADFFAGSFSFAEACINMGIDWICCEIDKEYFDAGNERAMRKMEEKKKEVNQLSLAV